MPLAVHESTRHHRNPESNEHEQQRFVQIVGTTVFADNRTETIERHTEPRNGRYRMIVLAARGDSVSSTMLADLAIPVDRVLGEPGE